VSFVLTTGEESRKSVTRLVDRDIERSYPSRTSGRPDHSPLSRLPDRRARSAISLPGPTPCSVPAERVIGWARADRWSSNYVSATLHRPDDQNVMTRGCHSAARKAATGQPWPVAETSWSAHSLAARTSSALELEPSSAIARSGRRTVSREATQLRVGDGVGEIVSNWPAIERTRRPRLCGRGPDTNSGIRGRPSA
jgi:hypothetical protein